MLSPPPSLLSFHSIPPPPFSFCPLKTISHVLRATQFLSFFPLFSPFLFDTEPLIQEYRFNL